MSVEDSHQIKHLGIIMDGNRRWAKREGLPTLEGHRRGFDSAREIVKHAFERGIKYVTLFTFSKENWNRSTEEVNYLMNLFSSLIIQYADDLKKQGIRLKFLGKLSDFSPSIQEKAKRAEQDTSGGQNGQLNLAFGYGGQQEIADAIASLLKEGIGTQQVTPELIRSHLYGPDLPDLDFIIRTSGEQRTSGFMLWQAAYAELYFSPLFWPEFSAHDLDEALQEFSNRQRRFGR